MRVPARDSKNAANRLIGGKTLALTPFATADADGGIFWRCGNATVPPGTRSLAGTAGPATTTIDAKYLPSACR